MFSSKVVRASPARTAGSRVLRELAKIGGQARDMEFTKHTKRTVEAEANEWVEFDSQISLANIGSNCGGGA